MPPKTAFLRITFYAVNYSVPMVKPYEIPTAGKRWDFVSYTRADTVARIAALPAGIEAADREVRTGDQAIADATKSLGLPNSGAPMVIPRAMVTPVRNVPACTGSLQIAVVLSAYLFPLLSTGPFTLLKLSKVPPEFELTVTVPEPEK